MKTIKDLNNYLEVQHLEEYEIKEIDPEMFIVTVTTASKFDMPTGYNISGFVVSLIEDVAIICFTVKF